MNTNTVCLDWLISNNVSTDAAVTPITQAIHELLQDAGLLPKQSVPYHKRILKRHEVSVADFLTAVPEGYGGSSRGGREMASIRDALVNTRDRGITALIVRW